MNVSDSASIGNDHANASISAKVSVEVGADAHAHADKTGISADASVSDVAQASVTASGAV
jgi:hypothetical protein